MVIDFVHGTVGFYLTFSKGFFNIVNNCRGQRLREKIWHKCGEKRYNVPVYSDILWFENVEKKKPRP
jgi:hypothetical protein